MNIEFNGNILIIGAGAVSQCLQHLILRHILMDFSRITIMDTLDTRERMKAFIERGAHFIQQAISSQNHALVFGSLLKPGDILIDLTVNLDTGELIDWCQEYRVMYLNASVEWWDPYADKHSKQLVDRTLYMRHMALSERAKEWPSNGPSTIVEHGANPGLVSHWTKSALVSITERILEIIPYGNRREALKTALDTQDFPSLAMITGTKVIHIAERDMQISNDPKRVGEFVNTWSIQGLYEEATAPAELGWGTHEKTIPNGGQVPFFGPRNQIFLNEMGMNVLMRSWVPTGEIMGMLIRHGESYSISKYLTIWDSDKPLYRPTVHYVYLPTDFALASLHEMKMHNYKLQSSMRIMNDDIIDGRDELGVLLLGHDLNGWWTGSHLSIQETRTLVDGQNATTLQVAAGLLGALVWMIKNPHKGFLMPDDLPYKEILEVAEPYLGTCSSKQTDWNPLKNRINHFNKFKDEKTPHEADMWQFDTFRVK